MTPLAEPLVPIYMRRLPNPMTELEELSALVRSLAHQARRRLGYQIASRNEMPARRLSRPPFDDDDGTGL